MLTKDPVITEIINEFKRAFIKLIFKKILLKSHFTIKFFIESIEICESILLKSNRYQEN